MMARRIVASNSAPGLPLGSWSPSEIGTALWLDASDDSTIIESGGLVQRWNDKAGGSVYAEQITGNRPLYLVSEQNGLNVIGTELGSKSYNRNLDVIGLNLSATQLSIFIACNPKQSSLNGRLSYLLDATGGDRLILASIAGSADPRDRVSLYNGVMNWTGLATTGPQVLNFQFDPQGGIYRDGSALGGVSSNSMDLQSPAKLFSAQSNGTNPFNGYVFEIIIYALALPIIDREKTEGYLAHKWGTSASLPSDHPYKSSAP